jgi:hypothetical protein
MSDNALLAIIIGALISIGVVVLVIWLVSYA